MESNYISMSLKLKTEIEKSHNQIQYLEQQIIKYSQSDTIIPQISSSEIDKNIKLTVERTCQCNNKTKIRLYYKFEN